MLWINNISLNAAQFLQSKRNLYVLSRKYSQNSASYLCHFILLTAGRIEDKCLRFICVIVWASAVPPTCDNGANLRNQTSYRFLTSLLLAVFWPYSSPNLFTQILKLETSCFTIYASDFCQTVSPQCTVISEMLEQQWPSWPCQSVCT